MRLKNPAQPLVFCFSGVSSLCCAVAKLYEVYPTVRAPLCLYRGSYFLAVHSSLTMRGRVRHFAEPYGTFLGPCRVLFSFFQEHGVPISENAVEELGGVLHRRGK